MNGKVGEGPYLINEPILQCICYRDKASYSIVACFHEGLVMIHFLLDLASQNITLRAL